MNKLSDNIDQKTKKKLNVLDNGETRRDRLWKECIHDAKMLMATRQELRWEIVALAEKCCVVHHGGRTTKHRYTLRNFAKEIGVSWGTFYQWYHLKTKIYDNLPAKEKKQTSYADLRFIEKAMANSDTRSRDRYSKAAIVSTLKNIKSKSETTIKMEKYLKHLKSIHWNVTNKPMVKDCDGEILGEICSLARGIVNALNKYDRKY